MRDHTYGNDEHDERAPMDVALHRSFPPVGDTERAPRRAYVALVKVGTLKRARREIAASRFEDKEEGGNSGANEREFTPARSRLTPDTVGRFSLRYSETCGSSTNKGIAPDGKRTALNTNEEAKCKIFAKSAMCWKMLK